MKKEIQISIRLESELVERFDRLVAKLGGASTRAALARLAMLRGLPGLEDLYKDLPDGPSEEPPKAKRARRR